MGKWLLTHSFETPVFTGLSEMLRAKKMLVNKYIIALLSYLYKTYICLSVGQVLNNQIQTLHNRKFSSVYKASKRLGAFLFIPKFVNNPLNLIP